MKKDRNINRVLEASSIMILIVVLVIIVVTLFKIYSQGDLNTGPISYEKASKIGDFLGGTIGTLITIASIFLIWLTYQSQKEELAESKTNFDMQNFDLKFFNLINLLNELVNNIKCRSITTGNKNEPIIYGGKACFYYFFEHYYRQNFMKSQSNIKNAANQTFSDLKNTLTPYTKMLLNIYKNIEIQNFSKNPLETKQFYIDTINSNFSQYELILLNYIMYSNCFHEEEKKLFEVYGTFDNLDLSKLLNPNDIYTFNK